MPWVFELLNFNLREFNVFAFLRPMGINYKAKLESQVLSLGHYKWEQMYKNTCSNYLEVHLGLSPILSKILSRAWICLKPKISCIIFLYSRIVILFAFLLELFIFLTVIKLILIKFSIIITHTEIKIMININKININLFLTN